MGRVRLHKNPALTVAWSTEHGELVCTVPGCDQPLWLTHMVHKALFMDGDGDYAWPAAEILGWEVRCEYGHVVAFPDMDSRNDAYPFDLDEFIRTGQVARPEENEES